MIKVIVIGIYSNKVIEEKNVKTYSIAEDYVYGKHNSVYDVIVNK